MAIKKTKFGIINGVNIYAYTLVNKNGLTAEILNYGGIIRKLIYKNIDVVLGRDSIEEYLNNEGYFGALIGRNSNRIKDSKFELNGKIYHLFANNGRNNLHGGKEGFDKKVWTAREFDNEEPSLVLEYQSPDGEEGFPGTVDIMVTYTLTNDNLLKIEYKGESDADTVLNMTNHSYFNLNGHSSGSIENHTLWLDCNFYTPNTDEGIPSGEILNVKNTPFDFREEKVLEKSLESSHEQIRKFGGFDHNFILNGRGYRKVGQLKGDETGIIMEIYTDREGLQIYSGNVMDEGRKCKEGALYSKYGGICLETQKYPNNLNYSHFPDSYLKKGEKYNTVTCYKFI